MPLAVQTLVGGREDVVAPCVHELGDYADQDEHTEEHPATPRAQGRSGMTPSDYVLLLERVQLPDGVQHLLPQVQLTWRIQRPTSVGE